MSFKSTLIKIIPTKVFQLLLPLYTMLKFPFVKLKIKSLRKRQQKIVKNIRKKDTVNVVFLVIHDSIWKYEEVYRLFNEDIKFNVKVVVIPLVRDGEGQMETYYQTLNYFNNNNYNTFGSFNEQNKSWLDVKQIIKPDLIFFTNPHKLTFNKYFISYFHDCLTCYVPYAFVVIKDIAIHYKKNFHQLLWRFFIETERHKEFYEKFVVLDSANSLVSGYPGLDVRNNLSFYPKNVWLNENQKRKKIIWAPHHTIQGQGGSLNYSSFEEYYEYFIELCENNQDIQVAFKPHPLLRENLNNSKLWGKEKTDKYYERWNELDNGQFENGAYIDLFEKSDAMITDSASFIAEYLYFDKPILFTLRDSNVKGRFNSFGQEIFTVLYQSNSLSETDNFINEQVKKNYDFLKKKRNYFLNNEITPKNKKTASENIYRELIKELC